MNANFHPVSAKARPHDDPSRGWVALREAGGSEIAIHTTIERARAIEAVFAEPRTVRVDGLSRSEGGYEPASYHTDMIAAGRGHLLGDR
jgi:hypothetical protein